MLKSIWSPFLIDLLSVKELVAPNPTEKMAISSAPQRALLTTRAISCFKLALSLSVTPWFGILVSTTPSTFWILFSLMFHAAYKIIYYKIYLNTVFSFAVNFSYIIESNSIP